MHIAVLYEDDSTAVTVELPSHLRKPRLSAVEASEYLEVTHGVKVSPATLNKLRCVGGGPAYEKFNRSVLYPVKTGLGPWALEKLGQPRRSTSEAA